MDTSKHCLSPGRGVWSLSSPQPEMDSSPPIAPLPLNLPRRRRRRSSQPEGLYQRATTITHWRFGADGWHWRN